MPSAYIGLGSNVGDSLANLRAAVAALDALDQVAVLSTSSVYQTAPQGEVLDQPDFLNAVASVETDLAPLALLDVCKQIEQDLGREAGGPRHGPRLIDLDVLLVGEVTLVTDRLTLPHPEISSRRFVLEPLLELAPDLIGPGGERFAERIAVLHDQRVSVVAQATLR